MINLKKKYRKSVSSRYSLIEIKDKNNIGFIQKLNFSNSKIVEKIDNVLNSINCKFTAPIICKRANLNYNQCKFILQYLKHLFINNKLKCYRYNTENLNKKTHLFFEKISEVKEENNEHEIKNNEHEIKNNIHYEFCNILDKLPNVFSYYDVFNLYHNKFDFSEITVRDYTYNYLKHICDLGYINNHKRISHKVYFSKNEKTKDLTNISMKNTCDYKNLKIQKLFSKIAYYLPQIFTSIDVYKLIKENFNYNKRKLAYEICILLNLLKEEGYINLVDIKRRRVYSKNEKTHLLYDTELTRDYVKSVLGHDDFEIVDGKVNVNTTVCLQNKGLTKFPFEFGIVKGCFYCHDNNLSSLKGAPREVELYFDCSNNNLTSLEGCPEKVTEWFICNNNPLRDISAITNCKGILEFEFNNMEYLKNYHENIDAIKYIESIKNHEKVA